MNIRQATTQDLPQLSRLFDGYRVFYRKESDMKGGESFLRARLEAEESVIYVCENIDGSLLGFTQLYPLFSSTKMKRLWLLNDLFVAPEHRGKDISKMLIEQAKKLVVKTGACGFFLETEKSNDIGNKLYPAVGMKLNAGSNYYEWYA